MSSARPVRRSPLPARTDSWLATTTSAPGRPRQACPRADQTSTHPPPVITHPRPPAHGETFGRVDDATEPARRRVTCTELNLVRPLGNTIDAMIEYRLIPLTDAPPDGGVGVLQAVPMVAWRDSVVAPERGGPPETNAVRRTVRPAVVRLRISVPTLRLLRGRKMAGRSASSTRRSVEIIEIHATRPAGDPKTFSAHRPVRKLPLLCCAGRNRPDIDNCPGRQGHRAIGHALVQLEARKPTRSRISADRLT